MHHSKNLESSTDLSTHQAPSFATKFKKLFKNILKHPKFKCLEEFVTLEIRQIRMLTTRITTLHKLP